MKPISPTPYPDVNAILDLLRTRVQHILGDQLVGMYLHGSLANGGFDEYSDIDIIFVTNEDISEETFSDLFGMHMEISKLDSPWAEQLEVSYIPESALRRFDRSNINHPHLDRGSGEVLHRMAHESDWIIQRHILREHGVVIVGPDPKTLVDPVSPADLRMAVVDGLPLWFNPIFENPDEIRKQGYQSFFVLSICRMLYTLRHGEIISKSTAAQWAMEALDLKWQPLIERALLGRQNSGTDAERADIDETLEMMRFALQQIKPTPYPEVNDALYLLLTRVKEILKDQFLGMYLYGSLSTGDFDPKTSDIDFLVVTKGVLVEETVSRLEAMHGQIWSTGMKWAAKLEGAYVPEELIRRHDASAPSCPTVNEGRFYVAGLGSDWIIQRHVVREYGVVVEGPDPKMLIDPVNPDEIRGSVLAVLQEWWFPMLDDPTWLRNHGREYHAFAILTMCRALHALEHGTIASKPTAARWAQNALGDGWKEIIEQSLHLQKLGNGQVDLFERALKLIGYTRKTLKV